MLRSALSFRIHRVLLFAFVGAGASCHFSTAAQASRALKADESVEARLRFSVDDETGNEAKALRAEILIQKSEKNALAQLQRLAKKNAGKPLEPDLLFRLAELYMRRARSQRFFEAHRGSEEALLLAPKIVQDASERAEILRAVDIYESLQTRFPAFRQLDVATFNEAFAREQLGQMDAADALFAKIPALYPGSALAPDAWLAMGEIRYQRRQYSAAHERFMKARAFPESRVYPYALYKAAWCLYNMQDAPGAMAQLEEVVAFGREAARTRRDAKLDLRKEALGDLAFFYGDVKPAAGAVAYFEKQAGDLDPSPYILRLIEIYKRHSRYADVEATLKELLAAHPNSESAPGAREELVWNFERAQKRTEAAAELESFEASCAAMPAAEPAAAKGMGGAKKRARAQAAAVVDPRAACRAKVADAAKKLAGKWHALWKKRTASEDLAVGAQRAYAVFFRVAPLADAESGQARYAYGELLFQRGMRREASAQYALAAAAHPPQPLAHDAAYAAIVALEKAVEEGASPASGAKSAWSGEDEALFGKLADAYLKDNPQGAYATDVRFKRGFIAYEKERYDEAGAAFKRVGWGSSSDGAAANPKVAKAQDLWLDILNIRKDYKGLKEAARGLLAREGLEPQRRDAIQKIYRQAYFSEIQVLEEGGHDKAAASAYQAFALENIGSELAPKAWWNASQLLFKIGDAQGGANACYRMHKLFPGAANARDCLTKSAQTFEAMGRLDLAARVLLNLAEVDEGSEGAGAAAKNADSGGNARNADSGGNARNADSGGNARNADKWRELAADFFALSGGGRRAVAMYEKLGEGKSVERRAALDEKIAALATAGGDVEGYRRVRARLAASGVEPRASLALIEEIEERLKATGDQTEAFNAARKVLARSGASKETHARARLIQAQVLEDEFRRQSVKARPERLALVLALKTEKLEKAQSALQSTIRYGAAGVTPRALQRLGGLYRAYAEALRAIAPPEGASAKDAEAFRSELERLATPLEEKGVESLAQAVDAAKKAGLHDGSVGELQAELDKANMKKPGEPRPAPAPPGAYAPRFTAAMAGGDR